MTAPLAILTAPACSHHFANPHHPERPQRLEAVRSALEREGLMAQAIRPPARAATREDLLLAHTAAHLLHVEQACRSGEPLAHDTFTGTGTHEAALAAAGASLSAVDAVLDGTAARAFALIRPPGHHAETERAMGFCFFNNVALAARHAQRRRGLGRIAIVDFDVHHGNGTQQIFWEDGSVFFASIHQYGPNPGNPGTAFFPGTGGEDETGAGNGAGAILNLPLPAGSGFDLYALAFARQLIPRIEAFAPDLLLISAGFDAHRLDPIAQMALDEHDFHELTRLLVGAANRVCGGRVVSLLEGGYHLGALGLSSAAHVRALLEP